MTIKKYDCVGHVQKRMGSRLWRRRKVCIYDEKKKVIGLGGKGRFTRQSWTACKVIMEMLSEKMYKT